MHTELTTRLEISSSQALGRYISGRARSVASFLGVPVAAVEDEVLAKVRPGVSADVVLDRIVIEAVS